MSLANGRRESMSLATGRTAVGLMTHGATQAGALADHSHSEYDDHGALALAEHSHAEYEDQTVINNTGTVYYTINDLSGYLSAPTAWVDNPPLPNTEINRGIVNNILQIDVLPTDRCLL